MNQNASPAIMMQERYRKIWTEKKVKKYADTYIFNIAVVDLYQAADLRCEGGLGDIQDHPDDFMACDSDRTDHSGVILHSGSCAGHICCDSVCGHKELNPGQKRRVTAVCLFGK